MPQIRRDRNRSILVSVLITDQSGGIQRRVQRNRWTGLTGTKEYIDQRIRQHGDFVARHINRRHARTRQLINRIAALYRQCRCGNMDADATLPSSINVTENASSISVVVTSSIENACHIRDR
jgi:hypothetical protein